MELAKKLKKSCDDLDNAVTITGVEAAFKELKVSMNAMCQAGQRAEARAIVIGTVKPEMVEWLNREALKNKG